MHYGPYQKYKAADNLFGQIPNEWRQERLHDVSEIRTSNVDKKSVDGQAAVKLCNYVDVYYNDKITSQIDFMPSTASDNEIERFTLYAGDVVFTKDSEDPFDIGIPTLITEDIDDLVCGYHLSIVKPDKNQLLGEYAYYALKSEMSKFQFTLASNGVTRFGLTYQGTKNIQLCIPSLQEQKQIAAFLDRKTAQIDRLIEKKKVLIEKLNEKRIALITHAVTKGLNPAAPMKPSGMDWLGDVPAHWNIAKFKFHIGFQEGPGIMAVDFRDSGVPLLRIRNVQSDYVNLDDCNYLDPEKVESQWPHFKCKIEDLLISGSASTGLVCEVTEDSVGAIVYTGLIRLWPETGKVAKEYIRWLVSSGMFFSQIDMFKTGSTIQHFGPEHLNRMLITVPPLEEQQSISEYIKTSLSKIDKMVAINSQAIECLTEYRTALITAAVTGKIDVSSIEISDQEAA